jgi:hypothetical protein
MQVGFPNEKLFPRRGKEINFTVNGKTRVVRGKPGEGAVVKLNGRVTNLNSPIEQNDIITVEESTIGEPGKITIGQLEEFKSTIEFIVNGKKVICPRFAYVNNELKSEYYDILDGDAIQMENFYTVEQLFEFLDCDFIGFDVYVNNELADSDTKVYENFSVKTTAIHEDPLLANERREAFHESTTDSVSGSAAAPENSSTQQPGEEAAEEETVKVIHDITIMINGRPVRLTGKTDYILVDLFQYYEFDLSNPKGNIVLKLNGETGVYTAPLKNGDVVDLYWEDMK